MAVTALTVPEGLALLLLRDADGRRAVELRTFHAVLAAGVLSELVVRGEVALDGDGHVRAQSSIGGAAAPIADAPLAEAPIATARARIPETRTAHTDEWWIARLSRASLTDAVLAGLVERGILQERQRTFLGFGARAAYPAQRSDEEDELREAVRWSLAIDHNPGPRVVAATIAILDAAGRLRTATGFIPDRGLDLRSGQWPAAALHAWLAGSDAAVGLALRTSLERGSPA